MYNKYYQYKPKYGNRKVSYNGMTFDSEREYTRWCELTLLQRAGKITDLQRQVKFILIPTQKINGKCVEKECAYIADFVYKQNGETIVEDAKGMKTDVYKIKKKLMLYIHKIQIRET